MHLEWTVFVLNYLYMATVPCKDIGPFFLLYKTCCCWFSDNLCNLPYLSFFSLFSPPSWQPSFHWDCFQLNFGNCRWISWSSRFLSPFFEDMTFWYFLSASDNLFRLATFFVLHMSIFLRFFKDTYYTPCQTTLSFQLFGNHLFDPKMQCHALKLYLLHFS